MMTAFSSLNCSSSGEAVNIFVIFLKHVVTHLSFHLAHQSRGDTMVYYMLV